MTLLDRFRAQPRQNPDPAVRLSYVSELPLDDRETIASVAREDEDPRVRRAAVAKLMEPRTLASIAASDRDEGVRGQALAMLRDIALESFEGVAETESLEAVDALTDLRSLGAVAKTTSREVVALRAVSRIDDPRIIGSIARHAALEAARRSAFEWLHAKGERAEILAVAMNGDFKDTAVSAVELLGERSELDQISARSRNKSAAKRARALIREADEQAALNAAQTSVVDVADEATTAATVPLHESIVEAVGDAVLARAPVSVLDPAAADAGARRTEDTPSNEPPRRDPEVTLAIERARARLTELAVDAEAALADADLANARRRFGLVRREWKDVMIRNRDALDTVLAARLAEVDAKIGERDAQALEAETRVRRESLSRLQSLLGRVEPIAQKADVSLKAADRALRDVRAALASLPPLPSRQDAVTTAERLKAVQAALTPRVQELREADEWRRFANVAIQEQLCAKMEALLALEAPDEVAREIRRLQEEWRKAADVPHAQADALWRRFKAAHDAVWPRCAAHFAALAVARGENLAKKVKLCEQAEALAESKNWIQTADEIKRLQAEWKTIGTVSHGREKAVWERFRSACDRFFTRRHEDLAARKAAWAENLARKEALCVRAETLAESSDWDATAAELKRLQADWKAIGPVKKSKSDAIWLRFRGACDRFFSRSAQRHDVARAERVAAREALCGELENLAAPDGIEPPQGLLETARAIRARWHQEIAAHAVDPQHARALDERFSAALARLVSRWPQLVAGSDLDPEANRTRMEALVRRVEDLALSVAGPVASVQDASVSPSTRLAAMLKDALASNTIGGKSQEDSRLSAAAEEIRQAQAAWSRIGAVPEEARRQLADRFQRACRRVTERLGSVAGPALRSGARLERPASGARPDRPLPGRPDRGRPAGH